MLIVVSSTLQSWPHDVLSINLLQGCTRTCGLLLQLEGALTSDSSLLAAEQLGTPSQQQCHPACRVKLNKGVQGHCSQLWQYLQPSHMSSSDGLLYVHAQMYYCVGQAMIM